MDLQSQLQKTLGDGYTLERELAAGGMARVFVARDTALGRRVVVKTLSPELAAAVSAERFRREIRVAASLQQANIVPVHTAGDVDGVPYYTMPFVEGESLRVRITKDGALPVRDAVNILRDVARALAFAHERGVVHRDIKPENILLSGNTAVVTDFGIAKAIEASQSQAGAPTLTHIGAVLGTPAYMSPEQAAGDSVDHRSDIYSLGIVAYELFAGAPPFVEKSAQALIAAHISIAATPLGERAPQVPVRIAALVMRCLEKDPERRPMSAAELLAVFDARAEIVPATAAASAKPSIAVLPFANLSPDPENEFFADGITDDLIAQVAKIGSLRVIARTSVMRYRGVQDAARTAARELGVTAVIEGTVRRAGKRARIVAQLIDPSADAPIWSETYDRDLDDIFSVQTEVATSVASALKATLTPEEQVVLRQRPTADAAAYDLYLLGRHHWNKRTDESIRSAIDYFERAIAHDQKYAAAYAGLADAYVFAGIGYAAIAPDVAFSRARDAAAQAIALDAMSPDAQCSIGLAAIWCDWDISRATKAFEKAVELRPNHSAGFQWLAWCQFSVGDYLGAVKSQERALELDPLNAALAAEAGWPYTYAALHDHAMRRYRRALEIDPEFGLAHYNVGLSHNGNGRLADAIREYEIALARIGRVPWVLADMAATFVSLGEQGNAEILLQELDNQAKTGSGSWLSVAVAADALGMTERALDALDLAFSAHTPMLPALGISEYFPLRNARKDPRFAALMEKLGAKPHDVAHQRELLLAHSKG